MTSNNVFEPLTDFERDALGEMANLGMGRAANSLRQMVGRQILLSVPSVAIITEFQAAQIIANPDTQHLVAVRQDFRGAFSGRALLIFPEPSSFELVRAVLGGQMPLRDLAEFEDEALAEIGNVILNGWVSTIANLLQLRLDISLPKVVRGGANVFERGAIAEGLVVFLNIKFDISQQEIRGYVAALMDIPSVAELRRLIPEFVASSAC